MEKEVIKADTSRSCNLDKLKALCAFLVVCIHAPFPGTIGEYFTALARIAVPIFFMISGYFYKADRSRQQIIKILKLILISNTLYFFWKVALTTIKGELLSFFIENFTLQKLATFILFNDTALSSHLWYLNAILYVLALVSLVYKRNLKKALYMITPVLLLVDLIFGKYSLLLFQRDFPYILVRNWLFVGLPYFSIGLWLKDNLTAVNLKLNDKGKLKVAALIFLFSATTLLERYLLVRSNLNTTRDHYLSTTLLAIAVFLFFLKYVSVKENAISRIGKNNSTFIYVFHPAIITILEAAVSIITAIELLYTLIAPFVVFATTTIAVRVVILVINSKMSHAKQKQQ